MVHHSCFFMAIALGRSKHFNHLFRPFKHDESRSTGSSWQFPHRKLLGSQNLIVSFCFGGETFEISMSMPMIPNGSNYIEVILMTRWWFQILYHVYHFLGKWSNLTCAHVSGEGLVRPPTRWLFLTYRLLVHIICRHPAACITGNIHSLRERCFPFVLICNPCTPWTPPKGALKFNLTSKDPHVFQNKQSSWGVFGRLPIGDLHHYVFFLKCSWSPPHSLLLSLMPFFCV